MKNQNSKNIIIDWLEGFISRPAIYARDNGKKVTIRTAHELSVFDDITLVNIVDNSDDVNIVTSDKKSLTVKLSHSSHAKYLIKAISIKARPWQQRLLRSGIKIAVIFFVLSTLFGGIDVKFDDEPAFTSDQPINVLPSPNDMLQEYGLEASPFAD